MGGEVTADKVAIILHSGSYDLTLALGGAERLRD